MKNLKNKSSLRIYDIISLTIGMVIGVGIFKTPALVAQSVASGTDLISIWVLGALISIIGSLCYGELCSTYPSDGGEYYFLKRAYGKDLAFIYAWSRITVLQTGSIALLSFLFGDYASQIYDLGEHSSSWYAGLLIINLTALNSIRVKFGTMFQRIFISLEIFGIFGIILLGFFHLPSLEEPFIFVENNIIETNWGYGLVLVLLTYGGWNEAAFLFGDIINNQRKIVLAFIFSMLLIALLYILVNLSLLRGLGLSDMAASKNVAVDLAVLVLDSKGLWGIVIIVAITTITSTNATIFTGAKSLKAFNKDLKKHFLVKKIRSKNQDAVQSYILQAALALLLVVFGEYSRNGFEAMIDYTAPVFWFFLFLTGLSLFVLRKREPNVIRPFAVPLYPILPFFFCCSSLYLFYASICYSGWGCVFGFLIISFGVLILIFKPRISMQNKTINTDCKK